MEFRFLGAVKVCGSGSGLTSLLENLICRFVPDTSLLHTILLGLVGGLFGGGNGSLKLVSSFLEREMISL